MNTSEAQEFLPGGWERSETPLGIPYYINHADETTHWEHPTIALAFSELDGMNGIKYGAYRTAMKLRATQKLTHLNQVNLRVLKDSFRELGIGPGSSHNDQVFSVEELEALLVSIFQLAANDRAEFIDQERSVELTLSFMLKCLDSGRTGAILVRSLKIILISMSQGSLEEKFQFMFKQVSTENSMGISKSSLKILLQDLLMLTDSIGERSTFKQETVDDAVESCWNLSNIQLTDTLNVEELENWMLREPVCIVWLPTLHRLATAETIKHEAKCSKCKAFPIVGFRYRCLKCTNLDLCQNCFWTQQTLKNHKLTHPTREYCMATTTGDDVKDFFKQMRNKITRRYRNRPVKVNYLNYPTISRSPEERIPHQSPVFDNVHARVNLLALRLHELEDGIDPIDVTRPPSIRAAPPPPPPQSPPVASATAEETPPPATLPPLAAMSPVLPVSPSRPDTESLEAQLRLESRIIDLQGKNKDQASARRQLEKELTSLEDSRLEDMATMCEMQQHIHDLQETNKLHQEKISQLLATPPMIRTVRVPVPVQSPPPSMTEVRTQGVNTPLQDGWAGYSLGSQTSSMLGAEEEDMEAILRDLLAAFPVQTSKPVPSEMNNKIFKAVNDVGTSISSLAHHMRHK